MINDTQHNATQQVFEQVLVRAVDSPDLQHGRLIHLMWRAPEQGRRLVQFYLNGRWSGVSHGVSQREAWLVVDHERHIEIEFLAVDPAFATHNLQELLLGVEPATQPAVSLAVIRDHSLPVTAILFVGLDGALQAYDVALFSAGDARSGFGAVFGEGGFGYDASTGPGLGQGELGFGPLGSDGLSLRWRSETLPPGANTIGLSLMNETGLPAAPTQSIEITTDRLPDPPGDVAINETRQLTWT